MSESYIWMDMKIYMSWASEIRLAVWSSRASFITTEFSRKKDYGAKRILCFFLHCVVLKIRLNLFNHHSRWTRWVPLPFMRPKQSCLPLSRLINRSKSWKKIFTQKGRESRMAQKKMIKFEFASGDTKPDFQLHWQILKEEKN